MSYICNSICVIKMCIQVVAKGLFTVQVHCHGSDYLLVPKLKWLGILPSEIQSLQIEDQVKITLTTRDRAHIQDILNRHYMKDEVAERKEVGEDYYFLVMSVIYKVCCKLVIN